MSNSTAIANWAEFAKPRIEAAPERRQNAGLRRLFWLYFWLLIIEGILRKWVAPSLATPLLMIRDPIPILILWIGIRNKVLPRSLAFWLWGLLAIACLVASFVALQEKPIVTLYGFRCDFLHLPILFIAPYILEKSDLIKMVRVILVLSIPIAILMVYQFRSPADAWINSGIDGTFKQIGFAQAHIRPPGPWSFAVGPFCYFTISAACLIGGAVDHLGISRRLLFGGAGALILAAAFCGSRNLLANVAIVGMAGMLAAASINPKVFGRYVGAVIVFGIFAVVLSTMSLVKEGTDVLEDRLTQTSISEGGGKGFVGRFFGGFERALPAAAASPILGVGLGVGTMGGSSLMTGSSQAKFLISEEEWPRMVEESGPVLGFLFIGFRLALVIWLGWISFRAVRKGVTLPLCLFGACATNILVGAFGQATVLGYTMLSAGLCLASVRLANQEAEDNVLSPELTPTQAAAASA